MKVNIVARVRTLIIKAYISRWRMNCSIHVYPLYSYILQNQWKKLILICPMLCLLSSSFLAQLSRRLEWAIVIAHRPSSVRPSVRPSVVRPSSVRRKLFTFSTSSPEPLDGFWWNLVGIKYSWSLSSVVVFRQDPPRGGSRAGLK